MSKKFDPVEAAKVAAQAVPTPLADDRTVERRNQVREVAAEPPPALFDAPAEAQAAEPAPLPAPVQVAAMRRFRVLEKKRVSMNGQTHLLPVGKVISDLGYGPVLIDNLINEQGLKVELIKE